MNEKMKLQILRMFSEFITSEKYKQLAKQKNAFGSKLRIYKSRYEKDELSVKAALLLLLDCGMIEEIIFKEN